MLEILDLFGMSKKDIPLFKYDIKDKIQELQMKGEN